MSAKPASDTSKRGVRCFDVSYGTAVLLGSLGVSLMAMVFLLVGVLHRDWICIGIVAIIAFPALFAVRGYRVDAEGVHVLRPVGAKLVACDIRAVVADEMALHGAVAIFANPGLFSITGPFRIPSYGAVRVWLTEPRNLVIVYSAKGAVMLSPRQPPAFVRHIERTFDLAASDGSKR